ncbi:U5 snRNP subunit, putative [Theileria annulata]|uniref:U5 snRNP subunit, putative n=1 Tax=Theileria annulata TaxID=5874 RepID=Q4UAD2_THEAN|nr:U5 snRNP subunit, putative [Theileria annulata]CAI76219.1 U5 snRNP subunit, putative [Theileria annulata]|eukprot:XP_952844.1 U5 snRNP subunit, putative [Theileria annulata]
MDQNLYDEFGNYIGPGFEDDYDNGFNSDISDTESNYNSNHNNKIQDSIDNSIDNLKVDSVVDSLKDSINSLKDSVDSINSLKDTVNEEEVYKGVEVYIREEDIQTIEIPIIKSNEINKRKKYKLDSDITLKNFHILEENLPENKFNFQFLSSITKNPQFIRNICIAGNFHDGKTTFIDRLIEFTRQHTHTHTFHTNSHYNTNNSNSPNNSTNSHKSTVKYNKYSNRNGDMEYNRYMDNRMDEQLRELSIKSTPISIILENRLYEKINEESNYPKYKSYLFNIFDTPGHVNFMDEFVYSLAICDGCVLIVDVLIGLTKVTEQIIIQCLQTGVHMCLILNCIDRLILELKLPPADAYLKIQHTIIEINQFIYSSSTVLGHTGTTSTKVSSSNTNTKETHFGDKETPFGGTLGPSTVTELFDPKNNNVGFGSSKFGIFFTLKSFATLYTNDNVTQFSKLLYGNYYYDPIHNIITTNNTTTNSTRTNGVGVNGMSDGLDGTSDRVNGMEEGNNEIELERTFVVFILEPLYKLISHIASDEKEDLDLILSDLSNSLFNTKLTHTKNTNFNTEDLDTEDYDMEDVDMEDEEDEENSSIENSFKNNKKKIILRKLDYKLTTNKIIRKVFNQIFTDASAFVDLILTTIPSSLENNLNKFICHYSGTLYKNLLNSVGNCDPSGPLIIFITKNYYFDDGFSLFGRIFSGTIFKGQKVKLLGPSYTLDDDEDVIIRNISNIWIYEGRYRIEVTNMTAGNWVMLSGIDLSHYKITTIVNSSSTVLGPTDTNGPNTITNGPNTNTNGVYNNKEAPFGAVDTGAVGASPVTEELELMKIITNIKCIRPIFKIGLEPLNPNELPKMINGLRSIEKSYPGSLVKVEESGEHIILGTGELYLDCILHDLRLFGNLEIKVSDPVVKFSETITESTSLITFTHTNNLKNKLYMISQPLESNISTLLDSTIGVNSIRLDSGLNGMGLNGGLDSMGLNGVNRGVYRGVGMSSMGMSGLDMELNKEWDILDIKNVWSFGNGIPDVLINDTIPNEVDINLLNHIKSSIIQGFQWAIKEGPLIEEHIRYCVTVLATAAPISPLTSTVTPNVKFRLINCELSNEYINITPGQIIPATRRLCYSSFLLSTPRLMEPILFSEIFCPADCVSEAYKILSKRRGHVLKDMPKPGTPFYIVHAYLPAIESFGFETDLRVDTSGQAFCLSMFDHWNIVPGDPLDKSIILRTLEPAPIPHLAREFLVKTRRRKGLTEDVSINTFFDEEMITSLAENLQEFY